MANPKKGRKKVPVETPKSIKVAYHINDKPFRWSFEKCLWKDSCWQDCESLQFFVEHIVFKLQDFETMKWQEILDASGGKSEGHGNNSHWIKTGELSREAKGKILENKYLEDYEKIFSLRLSGKERLLGVVDLDMFFVLLYDAKHKIAPSKLKHT